MDNYIRRDLEEKIIAASKEYSCILITGARQVGKTKFFAARFVKAEK